MASIDLGRFEDEDEFEDEDDGYGVPQEVDNMSDGGDSHDTEVASLPNELKALRACMVCTLVKTYGQFIDEGCDNCDTFLSMADRQDRVAELTSHTFEGMAAVMKPTDSWVAKYQGIQNMKPGIYALEVTGKLSAEVEDFLKQKEIEYRVKPPLSL